VTREPSIRPELPIAPELPTRPESPTRVGTESHYEGYRAGAHVSVTLRAGSVTEVCQ